LHLHGIDKIAGDATDDVAMAFFTRTPCRLFVDYFLLKRAKWPLSMRRRALRQDVSSDRNYAISMRGKARVFFRFLGILLQLHQRFELRSNCTHTTYVVNGFRPHFLFKRKNS